MIPKAAEGGIFDKPTIALIGEAGPEAVVPLSRGSDRLQSSRTQNNTLYINVSIGTISKEHSLEEAEETIINSIVKAVDRMS
jgi:phage-related minor tail protein